jgi:hypothetical protein
MAHSRPPPTRRAVRLAWDQSVIGQQAPSPLIALTTSTELGRRIERHGVPPWSELTDFLPARSPIALKATRRLS